MTFLPGGNENRPARARRVSARRVLPGEKQSCRKRRGCGAAAHFGRGPRAGLNEEDAEEEVPAVLRRWGVLRRRYLPDERALRRRKASDDPSGRVLLDLPGRAELPLGFRRGRRLSPAHAVDTRSVVRGRHASRRLIRVVPWLSADARSFRVTAVVSRVGRVAFVARRFVRLAGRVCAVVAGVLRRGRRRPAAQVWADGGGEHAAPAAEHESPGETKIKQLAGHGLSLYPVN